MEAHETTDETDLQYRADKTAAALAFWRVLRSKSACMYLIAPEITPTSESTRIGGTHARGTPGREDQHVKDHKRATQGGPTVETRSSSNEL